MMRRLLLLCAALPLAASAQLQLFVFDGTAEKAVSGVTDYGAVALGDTRELRFRARNNTNTAIALQTISLAGEGFTISSAPSLPFVVAPTNFTEIRIRFGGSLVATYSATFMVNQVQCLLRASVVAAASISQPGSGTLTTGSTIDFGRVQKGQAATRDLQLSNATTLPLTIQACAISGNVFHAAALRCPMSLAAGKAVTVTVSFDPSTSGSYAGSVTFDSRTVALSGVAYDPPLPKPTVKFDSALASGSQKKLAIQFDSASQAVGSGTVSLQFQPASAGMNDDPAIVFVSTGSRNLSFQVKEGDQTAAFPAGVDSVFQTGTTAGTITFRVKLGDYDQQFAFPVAGEAVAVDRATAVRRTGNIDVSVTGFDNTGSAGKFSFMFYDAAGAIVQPGAIAADWSDIFANYFRLSKVGGSFTMRATFPVAGDATQITGVDVQMANSAGTTKTSRISF